MKEHVSSCMHNQGHIYLSEYKYCLQNCYAAKPRCKKKTKKATKKLKAKRVHMIINKRRYAPSYSSIESLYLYLIILLNFEYIMIGKTLMKMRQRAKQKKQLHQRAVGRTPAKECKYIHS